MRFAKTCCSIFSSYKVSLALKEAYLLADASIKLLIQVIFLYNFPALVQLDLDINDVI